MKRRDPDARPNVSNSTIDQMMARLAPLENLMDKQYVVQKEGEYSENLSIELPSMPSRDTTTIWTRCSIGWWETTRERRQWEL